MGPKLVPVIATVEEPSVAMPVLMAEDSRLVILGGRYDVMIVLESEASID
jgi:hypothetical protein